MTDLDAEYQRNEVRHRAALTAEDEQRSAAAGELETRSDREWSDMLGKFEMRQVALMLDEGRNLDGQTARSCRSFAAQGGFRGVPVPWQALEQRAGETISTGTPDPMSAPARSSTGCFPIA